MTKGFTFYSENFIEGTRYFSDEQTGKYIRLLCIQDIYGHIPEETMISVCGFKDPDIWAKFKQDPNGKFYNQRLEYEKKIRGTEMSIIDQKEIKLPLPLFEKEQVTEKTIMEFQDIVTEIKQTWPNKYNIHNCERILHDEFRNTDQISACLSKVRGYIQWRSITNTRAKVFKNWIAERDYLNDYDELIASAKKHIENNPREKSIPGKNSPSYSEKIKQHFQKK
jgi:hypothetical protein